MHFLYNDDIRLYTPHLQPLIELHDQSRSIELLVVSHKVRYIYYILIYK